MHIIIIMPYLATENGKYKFKNGKNDTIVYPYQYWIDLYQTLVEAFENQVYNITHKLYTAKSNEINFETITEINNADLAIVVATGRISNIFWQLGVRHSSGKPTMILQDEDDDSPLGIVGGLSAYSYSIKEDKGKYRLKRMLKDKLAIFRNLLLSNKEDINNLNIGMPIHKPFMPNIKVFISYSHADESYKVQLEKHLSSLRRTGEITTWNDRKLLAGEEWDKTIKNEIENSHIVLLLISSDFIASDYCNDVELQKAIQKHKNKESVVIPIIVRPCDWKNQIFSNIQALPKDAKPLSKWSDIDDAFLDVVEGIRELIRHLKKVPK